MSVFKTSGGRNYRIQFRIEGKTYVKSAKTSDKRVAERMEAEWRAQIHARKYLKELEPITLNQMFDQYLLQPLSETTKKNAQTFFRIFRKHTNCDVYAHDFHQAELEKFVQRRRANGKKESGIRTHVLIFKGAWNRTNKKIYNVPELEANNEVVLQIYGELVAWVFAQPQFKDSAKAEFAAKPDAWLIAYAKAKGRTLVTHESEAPEAKKRVPIPTVCKAFDVPYVNTFDMLMALSTSFDWKAPASESAARAATLGNSDTTA